MIHKTFVAAALVVALAVPAVAQTQPGYGSAQAPITQADIQHLQDQVYDVGNEVTRLRSRDQVLADRLQPQLDDLRDEVIYLRVKLRTSVYSARLTVPSLRSFTRR